MVKVHDTERNYHITTMFLKEENESEKSQESDLDFQHERWWWLDEIA